MLDRLLSKARSSALALSIMVAGLLAVGITTTQADTSPEQTHPAKLQVLRAQVDNGRLDVLADVTKRANGDRVRVHFIAKGKRFSFTAPVNDGRVRFKRALPKSQQRARTGIMEMVYEGSDRVRPTQVRLRAANGKALLKRELLSLQNGVLAARGSLTNRAKGVVRLILSYERSDGSIGEWQGRATVRDDGTWGLEERLPAEAHAGGYLSIQFTGYYPRRIRGEQIAKQLLAGQSFDSRNNLIPGPTPEPEPTPSPQPEPDPIPEPTEPEPVPAPTTSLLSETFDGPNGVFASSSAFWDSSDLGVSENPDWFSESGTIYRRSGTGWTNSSVFRMWTRRTDLAFTKVEMDIRFNGWTGGTAGWNGINLWLNRKLRSNSDGSRINDGAQQEGYVVDFLNRDGKLYLMKKVGDTYHILHQRLWAPTAGTWYRWGGRVIDNGNGTSTIQVIVDGQVILQAADNGSTGGPRLLGGRAGLRSDYSDMSVDNIAITRD